ncbi:MAG: ATPase domain-containing protein [Candidatus Nanohaloarchaea archaeon]|nr:ATPase domain-containing protein [Candidatus Nanohaloarchaea archaeon]
MTTTSDELKAEFVGEEDGSMTFRFKNTSSERIYDVVKFYIDHDYAGFEYLDVEPEGGTEELGFETRNIQVSPDSHLVLTTNSRDEGVLLDAERGSLGASREEGGGEQEAEESSEEKETGVSGGELEEGEGAGQEGQEQEAGFQEPGGEEGDRAGKLSEEKFSEEEEVPEKEERKSGTSEKATPDLEESPEQEEAPERPDSESGDGGEESEEKPVSDRHALESVESEPEESSWGHISSIASSLFGGGGEEEEEDEEEESGEETRGRESEEGVEEPPEEEKGEGEERTERKEPLPSEQVERLSTGIIGLDEKMQGGFVKGTMNLVTGKTGTGKTAFSASFLKQGIEEGQTGVYVTTEERKKDIQEDIRSMFGWDFQEYEDQDRIRVMSIKPIFPSEEIENLNRLVRSYITDLLNDVKNAIDELDADRVVIDSVSIIEMFIRDEYMARVALSSLLNNLREEDVTAILTGSIPETSEGLSGGGIIEYLVDTVILLEFVPVAEEHKRTLTIRKMRRTDHDVEIFPFDITPEGIKLEEVGVGT